MRYLIIFSCITLFLLTSCMMSTTETVITDEDTPSEPQVINEIPDGAITVKYKSDNMGRNRSQYHFTEDGELIIDTNFLPEEFERGDIVYYKTPEVSIPEYPNLNLSEYNLARMIALPGEEVEIKEGQIYINDHRLDAFYGYKSRAGFSKEEYIEYKRKANPKVSLSGEEIDVYFNENMDKLKVPSNQIFVIVDSWWRGVDSRHFGPLDLQFVEGKVIGVTKEYKEGGED